MIKNVSKITTNRKEERFESSFNCVKNINTWSLVVSFLLSHMFTIFMNLIVCLAFWSFAFFFLYLFFIKVDHLTHKKWRNLNINIEDEWCYLTVHFYRPISRVLLLFFMLEILRSSDKTWITVTFKFVSICFKRILNRLFSEEF
jgi:hypothetical protein